MVRFLLEAGADQEHKTDEMHTALMEACMVRLVKYLKFIYWVETEPVDNECHFPVFKDSVYLDLPWIRTLAI